MEKVDFLGAGMQVALADVQRHMGRIVKECLVVWDSMEGKLPSFEGFCSFYVNDRFGVWRGKARWN